jgi:RNA polymerase sigma factor (sigma-70 family)
VPPGGIRTELSRHLTTEVLKKLIAEINTSQPKGAASLLLRRLRRQKPPIELRELPPPYNGRSVAERLCAELTMSDSRNDCLARLFSGSRQALRRYIRRLVSSRETADDIVQEAFLRTYEHADRIETPRAFLFSAARNLASDTHRRNRIHKTDSLGDFDVSHVVHPSESPEGGVLADEQSRLLKEAVERLSPQCRAAFTLRVFHDCSYKEIARRLGVSPKTVENHIARALRETHEYLRRRYQVK